MDIYKNQKLIDAFAIYVERQNALLPSEEEWSDAPLSPEFEARMQKLLAYRRHGYYALFGTVGRRVASIVVALLVSATILTASVEALRTPTMRFFARVYETFTQIFVVEDTTDSSVLPPFVPCAPTYVPEGYEVSSVQTLERHQRIRYVNESGRRISFTQSRSSNISITIDTEGVDYTELRIGNYEGITYSNKGTNMVVFTDNTYLYTLSSTIDRAELIKMAESLVEQ